MSDLNARCLEAFPRWLASLASDARSLAELLADGASRPDAQKYVASALNYLFKSLDLIPDGIEDLGYLDDAFVLRVSAREALRHGSQDTREGAVLGALAEDAALVEAFLGADYGRFKSYVAELDRKKARGRSVEDILVNPGTLAAFRREVEAWAESYVEPSFLRDPKTLVKLRAFLVLKLPPP